MTGGGAGCIGLTLWGTMLVQRSWAVVDGVRHAASSSNTVDADDFIAMGFEN